MFYALMSVRKKFLSEEGIAIFCWNYRTLFQVFLHARLFNLNSYTTVYHTPTPVDLIADFPRSLYHHVDAVINETEEKTNYHVLQLPTLHSVYQAYTAKVEITSCSSKKGRCTVIYPLWPTIFYRVSHDSGCCLMLVIKYI